MILLKYQAIILIQPNRLNNICFNMNQYPIMLHKVVKNFIANSNSYDVCFRLKRQKEVMDGSLDGFTTGPDVSFCARGLFGEF